MTNEQINIAIAKACGWFNCILPSQDEYHFLTDLELGRAMGKPVGRNFSLHKDGLHYPLPRYCNDLNAMHEAEKTLTNVQHRQYRREIWHSVNEDLSSYEKVKAAKRAHFSSTALQKAEAFLRVKGKWEEASK
jgi:hypothetical protein